MPAVRRRNDESAISSYHNAPTAHEHFPPFGIERALESVGHLRSQVEPSLQLTEHSPVQLTWHVDPPVQEILLLSPALTVHVDEPPQSMLHDLPQLPEQRFWLSHPIEQLSEPPQAFWEKSHDDSAGQVQLAPLQSRGFESSPLQLTVRINVTNAKENKRMLYVYHVWSSLPNLIQPRHRSV